MKQMTVFECFRQIGISLDFDQKKFANVLNVSQRDISRYENGEAKNIPNTIMQILNAKFKTNINWLITGEGEMFGEEKSNKEEEYTKPYQDNLVDLPYIPISARATFADTYSDMVNEPMETYQVYRITNFDYTYTQVLEINGDSMEPTLINKEKVLIRKIPQDKWIYYTGLAAIYFNDMFVVKRITSNIGGILTLTSDNPMGGTFEVKIDNVHSIHKLEHSVYRPIK